MRIERVHSMFRFQSFRSEIGVTNEEKKKKERQREREKRKINSHLWQNTVQVRGFIGSNNLERKDPEGCKRLNFSTFSGSELKLERARSYRGLNISEIDNYN